MNKYQRIVMAITAICGWGLSVPANADEYLVKISEQENCTVTLSPLKGSYSEGETVTVTLTPTEGAVFDRFEVYYECSEEEWWAAQSANARPRLRAPRRASYFNYRLEIWNFPGHENEPVEASEGTTYTFIMPPRHVEIEAFFTQASTGEEEYAITVTQTDHGTTFTDKSKAKAGQPVNITATGDEGYIASGVKVYKKETVGGAVYETLIDKVSRVDATHYSFTMPANPVKIVVTYSQNILGDVNCDGQITIADVTALVNIILEKDNTGTYNRLAADMNGDNDINKEDVKALVNFILAY